MKLSAVRISDEFLNKFRGFELFSVLSSVEVDDFLEQSCFYVVKKNDTILIEGDAIDHLYIVISGWVKLHKNTSEGKSVILQMVGKGGFFGEIAEKPRYTSLYGAQVVSSEAMVVKVPKSHVCSIIKKNGMFAYNMISHYSDSVVDLQRKIEKLEMMNVEERVYAHLHDLLDGQNSVILPYSKKIMANQLGMKPETFSRALKKLDKEGLSITGNVVHYTHEQKVAV